MKLVRPRPDEISDDVRKELTRYVSEHWTRARTARQGQVDTDYAKWDKMWRAQPREKQRSLPWPGASNLVVPLVRMHGDTFIARTLGMMFGTQRLVKTIGYPTDISEPLEIYLNYKSLYQWGAWDLSKELMTAGIKTGTAVPKTVWFSDSAIDVSSGESGETRVEEEVLIANGPETRVVPFDDLYVYPITAVREEDVQIWFHRVRYVGEVVKERCAAGKFQWPFETEDSGQFTVKRGLKGFLKKPNDVKRSQEQNDAKVIDSLLDELHVIETHFRYPLGGKYYDLVALFVEDLDQIIDIYFNPNPRNLRCFGSYRPAPRDGLFFGESWCEILSTFQEEASTIHNDRRNNSYIANAPMFKRKSGSLVPTASAKIFPGKLWDLEAMDDFDVMMMGRNYDDMLSQENFTLQLAERMTGMNSVQQGQAAGVSGGKRGIYSAQGTMAVLSESNDRQGLNIRDFRGSLGAVLKKSFIMQAKWGKDDPCLKYFSDSDREAVSKALEYVYNNQDRVHLSPFEIRTSTAAMNKEMDRQNLMQMAGVINQYYGQTQQLVAQLLNPEMKNPGMVAIITDTLTSMRYMAKRLLRAFDEIDPEGVLPNAIEAITKGRPDLAAQLSGAGGDQQPPVQPGPTGAPAQPLSRAGLESLAGIPVGPAGPGRGGAN